MDKQTSELFATPLENNKRAVRCTNHPRKTARKDVAPITKREMSKTENGTSHLKTCKKRKNRPNPHSPTTDACSRALGDERDSPDSKIEWTTSQYKDQIF